jgi:MGT family glycosyltransferase
MARVLLTVPPLTGHLNPALAVASALIRSGHEVAWAVHRNIIGDKLPVDARVYSLDDPSTTDVHPVGIESAQARGLESVRLFFEDYTLPMARLALPLIEKAIVDFKPDVMAVDHQMPAGALVARRFGLPWASLVTTSASILRMSATVDEWVAEQYRRLQESYLPASLIVERPDFSPYKAIVFSIEELLGSEYPRVDAPYEFVGPSQGEGRRQISFPWDWLQKGRQCILVTLGTVSRDRDTRFFEVIMEALSHLSHIQAVIVAPESLASKASSNVLVRSYVPQLQLLEKVNGVICHAGHNTVCEALTKGLPLIVSPIRDDQPVIAQQVIAAGAGLFMRHGKVTVPSARSAIEALLSTPSLAANANRLGQALLRAPGSDRAAAILAGLVGQKAPPSEVSA